MIHELGKDPAFVESGLGDPLMSGVEALLHLLEPMCVWDQRQNSSDSCSSATVACCSRRVISVTSSDRA